MSEKAAKQIRRLILKKDPKEGFASLSGLGVFTLLRFGYLAVK
jgi:hypothetical protein